MRTAEEILNPRKKVHWPAYGNVVVSDVDWQLKEDDRQGYATLVDATNGREYPFRYLDKKGMVDIPEFVTKRVSRRKCEAFLGL